MKNEQVKFTQQDIDHIISIVKLFDKAFPNDKNREIQKDLTDLAKRIKKAMKGQ